jgi:urease gamma subunit
MKLSPRETDKLLLAQVGWLAQKRLANGVQLNQVEATALIAAQLQELVRTGETGSKVTRMLICTREILGLAIDE